MRAYLIAPTVIFIFAAVVLTPLYAEDCRTDPLLLKDDPRVLHAITGLAINPEIIRFVGCASARFGTEAKSGPRSGTWVEEQTDVDHETKEAALGHAVDSGVVRAYQRSDRFEERRAVMVQWAEYLRQRL